MRSPRRLCLTAVGEIYREGGFWRQSWTLAAWSERPLFALRILTAVSPLSVPKLPVGKAWPSALRSSGPRKVHRPSGGDIGHRNGGRVASQSAPVALLAEPGFEPLGIEGGLQLLRRPIAIPVKMREE